MIRTVTTVLLLAAAVLLAGCNTIQGAGKDIQKAGQAVERAAKGGKAERLVVAAMPLVFARKLEQRPMKLADVIFRDRDVLEGLEHRVHRSRVARDFFFIPAFELLNSES